MFRPVIPNPVMPLNVVPAVGASPIVGVGPRISPYFPMIFINNDRINLETFKNQIKQSLRRYIEWHKNDTKFNDKNDEDRKEIAQAIVSEVQRGLNEVMEELLKNNVKLSSGGEMAKPNLPTAPAGAPANSKYTRGRNFASELNNEIADLVQETLGV